DALRVAYQTPVKKRTEEHQSHLKKYPKILKISTGALYLYDREIRGKLAGLQKAYTSKAKEHVAAAQIKALAPLGEDAKPIAEALEIAAGKSTAAQKALLAKHVDVVVNESNLAKF